MVKKLGIIVQAHMGSTRLPNKMMLTLCDKSVLGHVICRLKNVVKADELIIATSNLEIDNAIECECDEYKVNCYRGSDDDVLSRFYHAAKKYNLTDIARVCADNTLVDWELIDAQIEAYLVAEHSLVGYGAHVPLGFGCEVFSFSMLEDAFYNGKEHYHREHVTPYIYEKYGKPYRVDPYVYDYSKYRFTLDTEQDYELIKQIYSYLYRGKDNITSKQVFHLMENYPELYYLNKDVRQKSIKE